MINAINKPKVNFQLMLVTFLLNVVFNYIFISNYGLLGAAYGTLLAYLVSFVANQIILKKYLSINTVDVLSYVLEAYVMMYKKTIKLISK